MVIRAANPTDADALSRLAMETYRAAFSGSMGAADLDAHLKTHLLPEHFLRILEYHTILIAEGADRMVGYAQYGLADSAVEQAAEGDWELFRLYVLVDFQNQGIGTLLMQTALADPWMVSAARVLLDVWARNSGAIRFYERFGFRVIGERAFVVESGAETDPDWIMARDREA